MEIIRNESSGKNYFILFCILILAVLPFLILNYFNQPTPEDFFFGEETRTFGFSKAYRSFYKFWGGRFFGYILVAVNPLYFKSLAGYKLATLLMILIYISTLYFFISEFTKGNLTYSEKSVFTLSVFFVFLYSMPSAGQGFYWLVSVIYYNLGMVSLMLAIIFYSRIDKTVEPGKKIIYTATCVFFSAATAGSNELAAITLLLLAFLSALRKIFFVKKFGLTDFIILVAVIISVYIAFTSPENFKRAGYYENSRNIFYSVNNSAIFLTKEILKWIFFSPLLIITFILIPLCIKFCDKGIYKVNPYSITALSLVILYLQTFLVFWSTGNAPYDRILNFLFFTFIILWFYSVAAIIFKFRERINVLYSKIPAFVPATAVLLLLLTLTAENNIKTAYLEIFNGSAMKYDDEMKSRYSYITESKTDTVIIGRITEIPKSFFLLDISNDPNVFYNQGYSRYFNKKAIYIKDN